MRKIFTSERAEKEILVGDTFGIYELERLSEFYDEIHQEWDWVKGMNDDSLILENAALKDWVKAFMQY